MATQRSTLSLILILALALLAGMGCGNESDSTRPVIDTVPPAVPLGVAGVAADGVSLNWAANTVDTDLAGYIIYRSDNEMSGYRPLNIEPHPTNSFVDAHARPGRTYWYSISARDVNHNESARSAACAMTVPADPGYQRTQD